MVRKSLRILLIWAFFAASLNTPGAQAAEMAIPPMPKPGTLVNLSPAFTPAYLKGIVIHPENALKFDFLVHKGDSVLDEAQKRQEYNKLIKYFLAALTVPDKDQWVNLSPFEKDRIIEDNFGKTEMGRDLLAQDYLLKQITSSLMYPESGLGKTFWDKVYEKAYAQYGNTNIPVNTFNKVWIVPDQALIYESGNTAYVVKSHLKVMLEEDYLALQKSEARSTKLETNSNNQNSNVSNKDVSNLKTHAVASQIIRSVILPEIEKEVNEGKNFAMLRQVYSGMLLATWYKKALKESLLGKVYADKAKVKGVDQDPKTNEAIYQQYLAAFKKGVYNYVKEDEDKHTNQVIPRKYFAGGFENASEMSRARVSPAMLHKVAAIPMIVAVTAGLISAPAQAQPREPERSVLDDTLRNNGTIDNRGAVYRSPNGAELYKDPTGGENTYILKFPKGNTIVIDNVWQFGVQNGRVVVFWLTPNGPEGRIVGESSLEPLPKDQAMTDSVSLATPEMRTTKGVVIVSEDQAWSGKIQRALTAAGYNKVITLLDAEGTSSVDIGIGIDLIIQDATLEINPAHLKGFKVLRISGRNINVEGVVLATDRNLFPQKLPMKRPAPPIRVITKQEAKGFIDDFLESVPEIKGRYTLQFEIVSDTTIKIQIQAKKGNLFKKYKKAYRRIFAFGFKAHMGLAIRAAEVNQLKDSPKNLEFDITAPNVSFVSGDDSMIALADGTEVSRADMVAGIRRTPTQSPTGGIDMNSANLDLQIKRDGNGVPLPLAQQDMAQLSRIQGFTAEILEIKPAMHFWDTHNLRPQK